MSIDQKKLLDFVKSVEGTMMEGFLEALINNGATGKSAPCVTSPEDPISDQDLPLGRMNHSEISLYAQAETIAIAMDDFVNELNLNLENINRPIVREAFIQEFFYQLSIMDLMMSLAENFMWLSIYQRFHHPHIELRVGFELVACQAPSEESLLEADSIIEKIPIQINKRLPFINYSSAIN